MIQFPVGVAAARDLLATLASLPPAAPPPIVDRPLLLHGAGNLGRMVSDHLGLLGVPIMAVLDRAPGLVRTYWDSKGLQVLQPEEVDPALRDGATVAVCITTAPFRPIQQSLQRAGYRDVVHVYDYLERFSDRFPLRNGWFTGGLAREDILGLSEVLELVEDDLSRAHHLAFVAWHHAREEWSFPEAPIQVQDRYVIPPLLQALGPQERLLDVGAHHGETACLFHSLLGERLQAVWVVEPDDRNREALTDNLARTGVDASILPLVVGRRSGPVLFHEGLGYASQVSHRAGSARIPDAHTGPAEQSHRGERWRNQVPIDALSLTPTLLKLHLEGGELAALQGAGDTLRRWRPIVMATLYHDRKGLYETIRWVAQNLDDYALWVRLHGWVGTGLVLYGIPRERLRKA